MSNEVKRPAAYYKEARDAYQLGGKTTGGTSMRWYAKAQAAAAIGSLMLSLPAAVWFEEGED